MELFIQQVDFNRDKLGVQAQLDSQVCPTLHLEFVYKSNHTISCLSHQQQQFEKTSSTLLQHFPEIHQQTNNLGDLRSTVQLSQQFPLHRRFSHNIPIAGGLVFDYIHLRPGLLQETTNIRMYQLHLERLYQSRIFVIALSGYSIFRLEHLKSELFALGSVWKSNVPVLDFFTLKQTFQFFYELYPHIADLVEQMVIYF